MTCCFFSSPLNGTMLKIDKQQAILMFVKSSYEKQDLHEYLVNFYDSACISTSSCARLQMKKVHKMLNWPTVHCLKLVLQTIHQMCSSML